MLVVGLEILKVKVGWKLLYSWSRQITVSFLIPVGNKMAEVEAKNGNGCWLESLQRGTHMER